MNNLLVYKDLFLDEDVKKCISFIKHKDNEEKFMIFIFLMIYIRIYFFILIILKQLLIVRYLSC